MSLISLASGKSLWRGYEYYEGKRVHFHIQNGEFEYTGKVSGSGRSYDVHIDIKHPRKSTCNCPHADGKRIICKHMVASTKLAFLTTCYPTVRNVTYGNSGERVC